MRTDEHAAQRSSLWWAIPAVAIAVVVVLSLAVGAGYGWLHSNMPGDLKIRTAEFETFCDAFGDKAPVSEMLLVPVDQRESMRGLVLAVYVDGGAKVAPPEIQAAAATFRDAIAAWPADPSPAAVKAAQDIDAYVASNCR